MTFEELVVKLAIVCEERNYYIDLLRKLSEKEDVILKEMRQFRDSKSPHPVYEINVIQMARSLDPH